MRYKSEKSVLTILVMGLCLLCGWFRLPAQSRYTATETFDGHPSYTLTPTSLWDTCSKFSTGEPYCFRSPLPQQQGDSSVMTSPVYDFSAYGEVWLLFDHICKIARTDIACIEIREDVLGAVWRRIPSDCYKSVSAGYRQQQFSDASYAEWLTDSVSAVPTNAWWKTECFDLSTEAAYTKIQLRFKLKKGPDEAGRFAFGWLLDNIRLVAGEKQVLPPYLNLTGPVYAGKVASVGPFVVGFRAEGSSPVRVSARYSIAGKPFVAEVRQTDAATFRFEIPATPYGNRFAYTVEAEDSAGNRDSITRQFHNPFPQDGRDSDAACVVRMVSPAVHFAKAGSQPLISAVVRNCGITDLRSVRICWSFQKYSGGYMWHGLLPADFCSDTVVVVSLPAVTESGVIKVWTEFPNGIVVESSDTLSFWLEVCADRLHGEYRISKDGDFPDLEHALAAVERCGISETTILQLDSGTYPLWVAFSSFERAHPTDTLVITSASGKAENVVLTADTLHEEIIRLEKVGMVCFRRLTFLTDSVPGNIKSLVAFSDSCSHIRIEGCRFVMYNPEAEGITSSGRRKCQHLDIVGNLFEGGYAAIFISGNRIHDYQNIRIDSNCFEDQNAYGIYMMASDFLTLNGNMFRSPDNPLKANRQYTGLNLYACFGRNIAANSFRLHTGKSAVSFTGVQPDSSSCLLFANNEIIFQPVQNQSSCISIGGSCRNITFIHNSLLMGGNSYGSTCAVFSGRSDSLLWEKNLFVHTGRGGANCVWAFSSPMYYSRMGQYWHCNHYHIPFGGYLQADRMLTRLEEWREWSRQDVQATEGSVRFRDTSRNLSLSCASPICVRTPLVPIDITGTGRITALTTKGAYHGVGSQLLDAFPFRISMSEWKGTVADSLPLRVVFGNAGLLPIRRLRVGFNWNGTEFPTQQLGLSGFASGDTLLSGILAFLHPHVGTNILKLWTCLPNDTLDGHTLNDTLEFRFHVCDTALSGDYLVGGPKADFPDMESAWETLRNCGVSAPVRLLLYSGRYALRLSINGAVPGSDSMRRVTVSSYARNSDSVILYRDRSEGQRAALSLSGTGHWVFEHVTLAGCNGDVPLYSIAVDCSDSCWDLCFRDCRLLADTASALSGGFYSADVSGNGLQFRNCRFDGGMYGLYIQGQGAGARWKGVDISGNMFSGHTECSVYLRDVVFNTLSHNSASNFHLHSVEGYEVSSNRLHAFDKACCIRLAEAVPSATAGMLHLHNNECISNAFITHYGIEIGRYCHDISCCHNSISMLGSGLGRCLFLQDDETLWNIRIRHNLLYQGSGNDTVSVVWSDLRYPSAYRFDNNRYGWKLFVDSSATLSLRNGSLAACLRLPEVMDDILSQMRQPLTTLGAYQPEKNDTDAMLFSILLPETPLMAGYPVTLRVLMGNWGNSSLRQVEIAWETDGVFQSSVRWNGLLERGDTVTVPLGVLVPRHGMCIRVYIRNANGICDADPKNDTLERCLILCDSAMAGDYRIGEDFATLSDALEVLYRCGIRDKVRLMLPEGRFIGPWSLDRPVPGSGKGRQVCIVAETSDIAVLTLENVPLSGQEIIRCSHTGHWQFENLCFEIPSLQTEAAGIRLLYDCEDISVVSCRFRMQEHSEAAVVQPTEWGVCGFRFSGNRVKGGNSGLRFSASSVRPDSLLNICDNWFEDIRVCGIYLRQAHFTEISGNGIIQQKNSGNGFYGVDADRVRGVRMEANRIVASRGFYGLYLSNVSGTESPLLVANNEIHLQAPSSNCGIYLYNGCRKILFVHNSVLMEGRGMGKCLYTAFRLSDITLKNNHFVNLCGNTSSTQNEVLYFYSPNGISGWQADYNNYYSVGRNLAYCGTAISDIYVWRRLTGKDFNSRSIYSGYVDKANSLALSDYDSLLCPLLNEVHFDKLGIERDKVTTMGAYQSVFSNGYDWSLCSFDSLQTGSECPEVFQPLWIRIRNGSHDTVCFSGHPLSVHLSVDGPLQLRTVVRITDGCIAPGRSESRLLLPQLVLGNSGTYRITAIIDDPDDGCRDNDTLRTGFEVHRASLPLSTNMDNAGTLFHFNTMQGRQNWFSDTSDAGISPCSGHTKLCFPSGRERGTVARAGLPLLNLSGLDHPVLSVWYARDGADRAEADQIRILVSTDGGGSYRQADVLYRYKQGCVRRVWERADVDLSSCTASCVDIVFEGIGYGGGDQYIDSLCISGRPVLQWKCAPVPQLASDCRICRRGLSFVLRNPSSQPFRMDRVKLGYRLRMPETVCDSMMLPLNMPAYGSDTLLSDTSFVWETGRIYHLEAYLSADTVPLADTLEQEISTMTGVGLFQLDLPECVVPTDSIVTLVRVRNSGALNLDGIPLELLLNDSLVLTDTLSLFKGDSVRHRFHAVPVPATRDSVFTLEVRSLLECDADFTDNSCYARICLRHNQDTTSVVEADVTDRTFQLFPNPSHGEAVLQVFLSKDQVISVEIVTLQGQVVRHFHFAGHAGENRLRLVPPNFAASVYFCRVSLGGSQWMLKWILL